MLTYLGTFRFYSAANARYKQWHLWAVSDDENEVIAIHYGISSDIHCASGEVLKSDCDTELRRKAFAIAKETVYKNSSSQSGDEEFVVIDTGDTKWH